MLSNLGYILDRESYDWGAEFPRLDIKVIRIKDQWNYSAGNVIAEFQWYGDRQQNEWNLIQCIAKSEHGWHLSEIKAGTILSMRLLGASLGILVPGLQEVLDRLRQLDIKRVVYDPREHEYVPVNKLLPPVYKTWSDDSSEWPGNGSHKSDYVILGSVAARDKEEAKAKLSKKIQAYLVKAGAGNPVRAHYEWWLTSGMPMKDRQSRLGTDFRINPMSTLAMLQIDVDHLYPGNYLFSKPDPVVEPVSDKDGLEFMRQEDIRP